MQAVDARPKGHVFADGHRQGVGLLREQSHLLSHLGDVHQGIEDLDAVYLDLARHPHPVVY